MTVEKPIPSSLPPGSPFSPRQTRDLSAYIRLSAKSKQKHSPRSIGQRSPIGSRSPRGLLWGTKSGQPGGTSSSANVQPASPRKDEGNVTPKKNGSRSVPAYMKTPGQQYDRFIPNRTAMDYASSQVQLSKPAASSTASSTPKDAKPYLEETDFQYQSEIAKACGVDLSKRILQFKLQPPSRDKAEPLRSVWKKPKTVAASTLRRRISTMPERVLDAPGLADDYYLNLLDWSVGNLMAVALEDTIYVWNAATGEVSDFCKTGDSGVAISSVRFTNDGSHLAVGTEEGDTQIWDLELSVKVRTMRGHVSRVGVLAWDKHVVSSGSRDGSIWHHDVRVADHKIAELNGHSGEVCGLKWRADGASLASGGNDNLVNIWDARSSTPKFTKTNHTSAVKALDWCPWQLNLLATGGGSHDKSVHFWNTTTGAKLSSIDTGSQVTSIIWSTDYKEVLTTHGFPDNQLTLWSYPSLDRVVDIPGHESRVLYSALSPDGQTVVTGASDENLKFWKVFEKKRGDKAGGGGVNLAGGKKLGDRDLDELINVTRRMAIR
ncbi:ubiquitin-protein transferase activating protein [Phlyctochytrium planicorne]|nr:ubiquitin-protein transferase activating protein [Phlyctochytrium planicorne]